MSYRDRYEGEIDGQEPRTSPNRRWRRGTGRSVNVDFCGGGPGPSASGLGQSRDTHKASGEGSEGRCLEGSVIDPCPDGYGCIGVAVGATRTGATSASIDRDNLSCSLT